MKYSLLICCLVSLSCSVYAQNNSPIVFKSIRQKDFKEHFQPIPKTVGEAISQLQSDLTDTGLNYFRNLPEKLAVVQFSHAYYMLIFTWKMTKRNHLHLVNQAKAEGSTGDSEEIIRLCIAGLHRKLQNQSYEIGELSKSYAPTAYQSLLDSLRDVNVKDTLFGSWYVPIKNYNFNSNYSYSVWFEVVGKSLSSDSLSLKIVKILKNRQSVNHIKTDYKSWTVGQIVERKRGELRNWKEVIRISYADP